MSRLTIRTIDALAPRERAYIAFDERGGKFGVRVMPSGVKTFVVQYRAKGRVRRVSIGRVGSITPDDARKQAQTLLGQVSRGDDPAQVRSDYRRAPTMKSVCDRFLKEHVEHRCKPSTQAEYTRVVGKFIKPELGCRKVADITRAEIAALQHKYRHVPYQANRTLGVLSKLFNLCEVWGLRPDGSNPCQHVPKNRESKRERFLTADEIAELGKVLTAAEQSHEESPFVIAAIRLLVLTGCRLSEIQKLEWKAVKDGYLDLADTKTGPRRIPLPPAARVVLDQIPLVPGNPFVIAGKEEGGYLTDLERPWRRIRKRANLDGVRLHDLRHTYASNALAAGLALPMVSKLLGHTQIHTTMRYVHLADDPVREAAKAVATTLAKALDGLEENPAPYQPALKVVR
jgi:integrase